MKYFNDDAIKRIRNTVKAYEGGDFGLQKPQQRKKTFPNQQRLAKLTSAISGAVKWNAEEVYLDTDGVAQTVTNGLVWDSDNPVLTMAGASVDDVILVSAKYRPDGTLYWTGGSSGSGDAGSSNIKFITNKNNVSGASTGVFDDDAEDLGEFATTAALSAAYPTGTSTQAAKVLADGFYYTWSGSAWTSTASSTLPTVEYTWKNEVNCTVDANEKLIAIYLDTGSGFEWRIDAMIFRVLG